MTLFKTGMLNGIAVTIKMLTAFGLNKILAIYVGPSGYAVIGQFQNVIRMILAFASGAINTGVIKYTAEHHNDELSQHRVWQTAGCISLICTVIVSLILMVFNRQLASILLKDDYYSGLFLWLSGTLGLFVLNALLLAILNGKKEIKLYVSLNIAGNIVSLVVTGALACLFGLYGALVALVTNQSIVLGVTLFGCRQFTWFKLKHLAGRIDKQIARNLGRYVLMALASAILIPVSQIIVRNHLITQFGWEQAGYWDGVCQISRIYLMFATTTLSIYYLPRLSEINNKKELRSEICNGYKIIMPAICFISVLIYLFRDVVITVLFTAEFSDMRTIFAWQLMGDVMKIASFLLGYIYTAKAMLKLYIISEVCFSFVFVTLVLLLSLYLDFKAAVVGYFLAYVWHFLFVLFSLKRCNVL